MLRLLFITALAAPLAAQEPSAKRSTVPTVRLINTPSATSKAILGSAVTARQLPGGGIVVNDVARRRLIRFTHGLDSATVVADSVSGSANFYGPTAGALIGFTGDSLLFIDPRDLTMFVIGPTGAIARVAAVPRSQDAPALASSASGPASLDATGGLVYRAGARFTMFGRGTGNKDAPAAPEFPDSAAIVRVNMETRKLDTAAFLRIPQMKVNIVRTDNGVSVTSEVNPLPTVDAFAVVSDGSIAIVRGRDYHVDWVSADGRVTPTPKIPFDWQRLTDDDKIAVIDSAKAEVDRERAREAAKPDADPRMSGRVVMALRGRGDGPAAGVSVAAGPASPTTFVNPSELPDYRPAFGQSAARADLDGNVWIRTSAVRPGSMAGPIYDVVSRAGGLMDRVQLPAGRQIIGFGQGGVVYMSAHDERGTWIERASRPAAPTP